MKRIRVLALVSRRNKFRMRTTQAVVARLEGGGSRRSTRTLGRYAKATGSRVRISFEPTRTP